MTKPKLRQPQKSQDPKHSATTSPKGSQKSAPDMTPDEKAAKLSRTIHGIRELVMVADEHEQQKDYRQRVRESHQAMGEVAGFDMPDYDEDPETSNNFVVAAEGSTVNLGQENQPAQPPQPQQQPARPNGNGSKVLAPLVIGALGAAGLLGAGGLGAYVVSQLAKPEPVQPVVQPAPDLPETRVYLK